MEEYQRNFTDEEMIEYLQWIIDIRHESLGDHYLRMDKYVGLKDLVKRVIDYLRTHPSTQARLEKLFTYAFVMYLDVAQYASGGIYREVKKQYDRYFDPLDVLEDLMDMMLYVKGVMASTYRKELLPEEKFRCSHIVTYFDNYEFLTHLPELTLKRFAKLWAWRMK